jgi:hypothetical protein
MRDPVGMTDSGITLAPVQVDPQLDGDHERMSHIVLEGFKPDKGDFISAGPSVVEGMVNGTAVKALCGKIWVPGRNPKKYPVSDVQGDRRRAGLESPTWLIHRGGHPTRLYRTARCQLTPCCSFVTTGKLCGYSVPPTVGAAVGSGLVCRIQMRQIRRPSHPYRCPPDCGTAATGSNLSSPSLGVRPAPGLPE